MHGAGKLPEAQMTEPLVAGRAVQPDGFVYFLPSGAATSHGIEIDLRAMFAELWRSRWLVIVVSLLATCAGLAYALLAQPRYRAEVVLVPVDNDPTSKLMSQFGGLASLVGVNVGNANDAEPFAVLQSREFTATFVERHALLPVLFHRKWDPATQGWTGPEKKWPDVRDGVKFFGERVRRIVQDRKTGLVTISMTWTDPQLAARWAGDYVRDANEQLRARTVARAQANVDYLKAQIAGTSLVALQQPAGKLLELELQKLMLARSDPQFAFRVVDAPQVPKKPVSPRRKLAVVGAFVIGFMLACLYVIVRLLARQAGAAARTA